MIGPDHFNQRRASAQIVLEKSLEDIDLQEATWEKLRSLGIPEGLLNKASAHPYSGNITFSVTRTDLCQLHRFLGRLKLDRRFVIRDNIHSVLVCNIDGVEITYLTDIPPDKRIGRNCQIVERTYQEIVCDLA